MRFYGMRKNPLCNPSVNTICSARKHGDIKKIDDQIYFIVFEETHIHLQFGFLDFLGGETLQCAIIARRTVGQVVSLTIDISNMLIFYELLHLQAGFSFMYN